MGRKNNELGRANPQKIAGKPLFMAPSTGPDRKKQTEPVRATSKHHYTMEELLASSDYPQVEKNEDREWVDAPPVGHEPL